MLRAILGVAVLVAWPALCTADPQQPPPVPVPVTTDPSVAPDVAQRLDEGLAEADKLRASGQLPAARARYEALARDAQSAHARRHQAAAFWGLGRVLGNDSQRAESRTAYAAALAIYRELGDRAGEAMASRYLGVTLFFLGEYAASRTAIERAIALYQELDDVLGLAVAYNNLVYLVNAGPEKDRARELALRYAREAGDRSSECGVLHEWGDDLFDQADFITARLKLREALTCREELGDAEDTGRVLVSLGRLQRAHGQLPLALEYYQRALALQQQAGGPTAATIQSLNAMAVTYHGMGRPDEALAHYERALADARTLKAENMITFMIGQLGGYYLTLQQYDKAVELLEASLQLNQKASHLAHRYRQLAGAYRGRGDLIRAQEYADRAVAAAQPFGPEAIGDALAARSQVSRARRDFAAAERDLREAIRLVEDVRAKTIPVDFMKRGFSDMHQSLFGATIELLTQQGRHQLALETAEQARARAFLDLLASRREAGATTTASAANDTSVPSSSSSSAPQAPATSASPAATSTTGTADHASGLAARSSLSSFALAMPQLALDSSRNAPPANMAAMIATAKRLRSTLLTYWVGQTATYAWVVSPRGTVHAKQIDLSATELEALVAEIGQTTSSTEGGWFALGRQSQTRAWRTLYGLIIRPIRPYLPTAPDSLLTIVPHGPLFRVSFAALQDEKGRYLIEQYRLHYTPAVGVLQFTAEREGGQPGRAAVTAAAAAGAGTGTGAGAGSTREAPRALLVGDPGAVTPEPGGPELPALPWARREVDEIAAQLPAGSPQVLVETSASETDVRAKLAGMDLLHFATHGVIQQQRTLSSFLALRGGGSDAAHDGRLTAEEVYGLSLQARLVVLSACSTALGPMSGDGVIGFTRAFLYAGASSVIATEWDVPDEAGYELMRRFYRHRAVSGRESRALRAAQLDLIAALRKGSMKVATPGGDVALPEHPLFWAGFVLVGEP